MMRVGVISNKVYEPFDDSYTILIMKNKGEITNDTETSLRTSLHNNNTLNIYARLNIDFHVLYKNNKRILFYLFLNFELC